MNFDLDEEKPYAAVAENEEFRVVDWEGNVILSCGVLSNAQSSAEDYAELMNRAFRRGYKAGLRKGRQT